MRCFIAIKPLDKYVQTKGPTPSEQNEFEESLNKQEFVYSAVSLYCTSTSHSGEAWECQKRIVHNNTNPVVLLCPERLDDFSFGTVFYEAMSIVNLFW